MMLLPQNVFGYVVSCLLVGVVGWVAAYVGTRPKAPADTKLIECNSAEVSNASTRPLPRSVDVPERQPTFGADERKLTVIRIARRDGVEVTPRETAIVTAAAEMYIARNPELQPSPAVVPPVRQKMNGTWTQEGRALVHSSHNVAHQPVQFPMAARSRIAGKKGVA